jgi:hypothetical protein
MKSGEKKAREQSKAVEVPAFRVPASLAEAYELGWRWQCESFVGLREFGTTKEGVVRREGLAYFVPDHKTDGIVIPFVATYEFGTPRQPKYPYESGSVLSVDEEPEPEIVEPKTPKQIEEERVSLWKVDQLYQGKVIATVQVRGPREDAWDEAMGLISDETQTQISEVLEQPSDSTAARD